MISAKSLFRKQLHLGLLRQSTKKSVENAVEIIRNTIGYFSVLVEIEDKITKEIEEELITSGSFYRIGNIDQMVSDKMGFYCIRLREDSTLPEKYQLELIKRESRIIYIGKAEKKTLKVRFLGQELRARGHGTFFRSIGVMLGYSPPKGSLKDKNNQNNYRFSKSNESKIIGWMNANLEASWVIFDGPFTIEDNLIRLYNPLLNIKKNPLSLQLLIDDRDRCRNIARGIKVLSH